MGLRDGFADIATASSRAFNRFVKRNSRFRHLAPPATARHARTLRSAANKQRKRWAPVDHRADLVNIYHCCVQKTGSQWIQSILADLTTYRYCGLYTYSYESRQAGTEPIGQRHIDDPFPGGSIVSPLYLNYPTFEGMPKSEPYRAFFVQREPRDLVVSAYYSQLNAHIRTPRIQARRDALAGMSLEDGLIDTINRRMANGYFDALASWVKCPDPSVMVVRYEDLVGPESGQAFAELFQFLDIRIPSAELKDLLAAYSFTKLTGRRQGEEQAASHLRSASPGTWRKHFTDRVSEHWQSVVPALAADLGYE